MRIPPFVENRSTKVERLKHDIPPTSVNNSCIQMLSSLTISAIPNHHPSTSKCISQAELEEESNTILSSSYSNFGNHCLNYEFNKQLSKILYTTTHSLISPVNRGGIMEEESNRIVSSFNNDSRSDKRGKKKEETREN